MTPKTLQEVAARVVWFQPPEETLADLNYFLAYVMTYGALEDVVIAQQHFSREEFRMALENAPAGVFDRRSWVFWHTVLGIDPVPPLPRRPFLDGVSDEDLRHLWPFK